MEINSGIPELDSDCQIVGDKRCFSINETGRRNKDIFPPLDLTLLPTEYIEWMQRVGPAGLLRELRAPRFKIEIYETPVVTCLFNGMLALKIGFSLMQSVYFLSDQYGGWGDEVVLLGRSPNLRRTGCSFYKWLLKEYCKARQSYRANDWRSLVNGPPPFSPQENRVMEWRNQIKVERIEDDSCNNIQILLSNTGALNYPYFSLELLPINSGVVLTLRTDSLSIKYSKAFRINCYKDLFYSSDIQISAIKRDKPDDRPWLPELDLEACMKISRFAWEKDLDKKIHPKTRDLEKVYLMQISTGKVSRVKHP